MRARHFACAFLALSCSGPPERVAKRGAAVIAGEVSVEPRDDAVLLMRATAVDEATLCSATLIAPNLAITAHHCVAPMVGGRFRCNLDATLDSVDPGAGTLGRDYAPETLEFYAGLPPRSTPLALGARIVSTLSSTICLNDIALVELDRAVVGPYASLRLDVRAEPGELVSVVGYGFDADSEPGALDYRTQPRLTRAGLMVSSVGPDSVHDGIGEVMPRMFSLAGPSVCLGDSGGPAFAESDDGLLGVYSTQLGERCASPSVENYFVHLPPYRRMILDAFAAAGAEPWLSGDPDPRLTADGAPCSDDSECQSGGCVENACATACVNGACGAGFRCNADIGPFGVCDPDPVRDPPGVDPPPEPETEAEGCAFGVQRSAGSAWALVLLAGLLGVRRRWH